MEAIEQKKTILILHGKPQSVTAAETFLRNRDWKIFSTGNLKAALAHIVQHQPAFVLVSVDHPNKKVRSLPKILTQAFPVCVMVFAESSSSASFGLMTSAGTEYMLYPPLTGPAIERTVNKYYKDLAARNNQTAANKQWDGANGSDNTTISIKGAQADAMSFKGDTNAQNLFAQLMGDEGGSPVMQPGYGSADPQSTHNQGESAGAGGFVPGVGGSASNSSGGSEANNPDAPSYGGFGYDDFSGDAGSSRRKKDAGGGWVPLDILPDSKTTTTTSTGFQRTPEESIILKGTKDALEKSVLSSKHVHGEKPSVQKLEQSSNVACIVVESPRFSGYLVTALGKNRKIDETFLKSVHDKLFKFLRDNGESVKQEETMNIKIKQVPFEDWAIDCAEFLRKSVHNGDEVAMAFFPYAEAKTQLEESHHADMASVKLADLKADAEVEMNLYVYLPTNQKYVLYTPRGGKLYGAQKERLAKQGVTHMHMLKMEADDLNKYRAQNYLNDKIEEFEARQREREAAKRTA